MSGSGLDSGDGGSSRSGETDDGGESGDVKGDIGITGVGEEPTGEGGKPKTGDKGNNGEGERERERERDGRDETVLAGDGVLLSPERAGEGRPPNIPRLPSLSGELGGVPGVFEAPLDLIGQTNLPRWLHQI